MKVIHFLGSLDQSAGGVASYMQLVALELKKIIDLLVVTGISRNPLHLDQVKVKTVDLRLGRWYKLKNEFRSILKSENPDIVHINGIWNPQNFLFQEQARALNIKVVISPHGMLEPYILNRNSYKKKLAMLLYQKGAIARADCLLTTAGSELENIRKLGFNSPAEIIPNGLDTSIVEKKKSTVPDHSFLNILFLSRIHPKKGLEILIESISQLRSEKIKVVIAGEGDAGYITALHNLCVARGVEDKIMFLGGVYDQHKWDLYEQTDLFVLPTYSENFGIVVIEALAAGVPVITTKGTPWQELETYKCGWWIDLDIASLSRSIKDALALPKEELRSMGERGRQLVESKYDNKVVAKEIFRLYNSVLNRQ